MGKQGGSGEGGGQKVITKYDLYGLCSSVIRGSCFAFCDIWVQKFTKALFFTKFGLKMVIIPFSLKLWSPIFGNLWNPQTPNIFLGAWGFFKIHNRGPKFLKKRPDNYIYLDQNGWKMELLLIFKVRYHKIGLTRASSLWQIRWNGRSLNNSELAWNYQF